MHGELSKPAQRKVNELADNFLIQLQIDLQPHLESYSQYHMMMNVITGSMVKMMQRIPDELRDHFIQMVLENLVANLNNFRKLGV